MSATVADQDEALVRRFLVQLHREFTKYDVVMWDPPSESTAISRRSVSATMCGRESELRRAMDWVAERVDVVVRGAPGIGKTTLLEALHQEYPQAVFVRLEQGGAPMRDLRLALHRQCGGEFPVDDDQGIALIVRALPEGGILLVDNADEPESAAAILRLVGHVTNLTVVAASRGQAFAGFQNLELPPLSEPDIDVLLSPFDLEPSRRMAVLERAGGNPLLLRQEAWAAQEGTVEEDDDRLDAVLRRFMGDERRVLWLIGEMPSATLPTSLLIEVGHLTQSGLDLLRRNAVAKPSESGYQLHQTLRAACRELLTTVSRDQIATLRVDAGLFYLRWLDMQSSLETVDAAFPDLMHLLEQIEDPSVTVDLALALIGDRLDDPMGYIPSRGLAGLFREKRLLLQGAAATVGGKKGAQLEKNLGLFCHWGDDSVAEELVLSSRSRFREAEDLEGQAASTWVLGIMADDSCHHLEAERLYGAPLAYLHNPATRAVGHHLVGCALYHQGRFDEARTAFEQARTETDDAALVARIDRRLAYIELIVGDANLAIKRLEESRRRAETLNRPRDEARIARHIAEGYLRLGDLSRAGQEFTNAREIFERMGDKRGLAVTLLGQATTRRRQGQLAEASSLRQRSWEIASGGDGSPTSRTLSPVGIARAEEEASQIASADGDTDAALRHRRRACNVYEAIGHRRSGILAHDLGSQRDAPFPSPQGILFDLVDTLAETEQSAYEEAKQRLSRTLGVDHDHFKAVWARSRQQASTDANWTPHDRILWVAQELDVRVSDETLNELADAERTLWSSSVRLRPEALEILERIRRKGIKMALVSNGSAAMRELPCVLGLMPILSASIMSCEVGVLKPHAGIYDHALQALDLPPQACIYVGDGNDRELDGAQAVGVFAVRMLAGPRPEYRTKNSLSWDATVHSLEELAQRLGV